GPAQLLFRSGIGVCGSRPEGRRVEVATRASECRLREFRAQAAPWLPYRSRNRRSDTASPFEMETGLLFGPIHRSPFSPHRAGPKLITLAQHSNIGVLRGQGSDRSST